MNAWPREIVTKFICHNSTWNYYTSNRQFWCFSGHRPVSSTQKEKFVQRFGKWQSSVCDSWTENSRHRPSAATNRVLAIFFIQYSRKTIGTSLWMQWIFFPVQSRAIVLFSVKWPGNILSIGILTFSCDMNHSDSISVLEIAHKRQAHLEKSTMNI